MTLKRVTLTGADDSVDPADLIEMSKEFPFCDWGILVSRSRVGGTRFPSLSWIQKLQYAALDGTALSLHVCGSYVRDLLVGTLSLPRWIVNGFGRVQLNFHAEKTPCLPVDFADILGWLDGRQIIFQFDGATGNTHCDAAIANGAYDCVPLFDVSGGAGIVPNQWPRPAYGNESFHGYAGGLGPDNVVSEYHRIVEAAGESTPIWIDMETKLYSNGGTQFDLAKCRSVLEQMKPFIG